MSKEIWYDDGSILYQQLTPKYLEAACKVVRATLFTSGNVCKAIGVPNDPEALAELDQLPQATARDGVSVIAIDKKEDKVIGIAFNKILESKNNFYQNYAKSFKNPKALQIIDFIVSSENKCDLFSVCQTECLMELLFLGTLQEYRNRGVAKKLSEISLEIAQKLVDGVNVKISLEENKELPLHPVPKAVTAIFTSFISQRIGRQLGFETAVELSNKQLEVGGKGNIQYQVLTAKYLDAACNVVKDTLFTHGNLSKNLGVPNDPEALAELDQMPRTAAKDGISVIAIDTKKDKVVGVAFNKFLFPTDMFYENFTKSFKNPRALRVIDFIVKSQQMCNLFDLCQADCLMEISLLCTLPEYRRQGIGNKLCEISLELAQKIVDGVNMKRSLDGKELALEPIPGVVTAIFASFISQRIGRQLGFQIAAERNRMELTENCSGEESPTTTLEYKKLNTTK